MKLSLEEAQDKRKLNRTISLIKAQIEYILWLLSNTTSNAGSGTTITGGSTVSIDTVLTLPPVPTTSGVSRTVFWTSLDGGTGDNQHWESRYGSSRWYPMWFPTSKNGTPGL